MEIAYIGPQSVRIKGKQVTFLVNPQEKNKTVADGAVLTGNKRSSNFTPENIGILFQGPGEYEIKGTKITGFMAEDHVMFTLRIEGMAVFIGSVSQAIKAKDTLHEHDIAVLFADEILSQTTMGILNASVIIFVDEKAEENAKAFGKNMQKVTKYVVTKEKLPAETEFLFLG